MIYMPSISSVLPLLVVHALPRALSRRPTLKGYSIVLTPMWLCGEPACEAAATPSFLFLSKNRCNFGTASGCTAQHIGAANFCGHLVVNVVCKFTHFAIVCFSVDSLLQW